MRRGEATVGPTEEALLREWMVTLVRERPILSVVTAGAIGAALGRMMFGRTARLVFLGALGYVANELWRSEGRFEVLRKLAGR
jgi:hypothetical protein